MNMWSFACPDCKEVREGQFADFQEGQICAFEGRLIGGPIRLFRDEGGGFPGGHKQGGLPGGPIFLSRGRRRRTSWRANLFRHKEGRLPGEFAEHRGGQKGGLPGGPIAYLGHKEGGLPAFWRASVAYSGDNEEGFLGQFADLGTKKEQLGFSRKEHPGGPVQKKKDGGFPGGPVCLSRGQRRRTS